MTWPLWWLLFGPASVAAGLALDLALGDPRWLPHPVVGMGRAIVWLEPRLRGAFPATPGGLRRAGRVLLALLALAPAAACLALLALLWRLGPWAALAANVWLCYQLLAARELLRQTAPVRRVLDRGDLPGARAAVSRVVGRDVASLDRVGVARAAVETVAENAADGVVSPMLWMCLGGAPAGLVFKAVSTLDSMVGYDDGRYRDLGRASALADDAANLAGSRLCALAMVAAAPACGLSARGAWRCWRRDHGLTASPNAGNPESACAGALGVRLGGPAVYGGVGRDKPWLGDGTRPIEPADIARAGRLMLASSALSLIACCALWCAAAGVAVLAARAVAA